MANALDELIAQQKKDGTYYAPATRDAVLDTAAAPSGPVIAGLNPDIVAHNAQLDQEAADAAYNAVHQGRSTFGRSLSPSQGRGLRERALADSEAAQQFQEAHTLSQEAYQQHRDAIEESHRVKQEALNQSLGMLELHARDHDLNEKIQSNLDAADFLREFKTVPANASDHDERVAEIAAKYPRAGNVAIVQQAIGMRDRTRQNFVHADEIATAHQVAKQDAAEAKVQAYADAGYLTPDDFKWNPSKPINQRAIRSDGTLNTDYLIKLGSKKAGEAFQGKSDDARQAAALKSFQALTGLAKAAADGSGPALTADQQEVLDNATAIVAEGVRKQRAAQTGTTTVAPAAPAKAASAANLVNGLGK